jgi:penicillin G amidase
MKLARFLITLAVTVILTLVLDTKLHQVPPLGRFFDPFKGFWQNAQQEPIIAPERLALEGLIGNVDVHYDELLIPHIFAENEKDLYKVQGYVTAFHRLWQMELQTHAAAGRVSEIIGKATLEFDRLQRRKGMVHGAKNALMEMERDTHQVELMQAYVEGVNAYINSLDYKSLPFEYKLLDYKPEAWTTLKTGFLLKYMADNLSGWDADLENTNLLRILGKEGFDFLFPEWLPEKEPIIPRGTRWNFRPDIPAIPQNYYSDGITRKTIAKPNPDNGSNNWAISGNKAANGNPILANDPHLGLNLPSLWFVAQLQTPEMNVFGATLPGALGIIIGFNDSIAWGVTNSYLDVRDWYRIHFRNESRTEYLYNGKWLKTQRVIEEIKIREGETFYDTVLYTHHGPVVYDKHFMKNEAKDNFALRWLGHEPTNEQLGLLKLNKASNHDQYLEAISLFSNPGQNFVFAAANGDIAIKSQGKFPIKWKEQGKFLLDGSLPEHEWQGFIPAEHLPHIKNPERGFVSSANQIPADPTYPYYVYYPRYEHYRNRRINQMLSEMQNVKPADMMKLQNDNYSLLASESLPVFLENINETALDATQREVYTMMQNWDYFYEINQKAPSVFEVWWNRFNALLWDEFENDSIAYIKPEPYSTVNIIRNFPESEYIDILSTPEKENLADLVQASFVFAIDSVHNWSEEKGMDFLWGDFKSTSVIHLAKLEALSIPKVLVGGHKHIINANSPRDGASWRMIVELGSQPQAWGVYPGGQSGNPGNPFYTNMVEAWANGEYYNMLFIKDKNDPHYQDKIIFRQIFQPSL